MSKFTPQIYDVNDKLENKLRLINFSPLMFDCKSILCIENAFIDNSEKIKVGFSMEIVICRFSRYEIYSAASVIAINDTPLRITNTATSDNQLLVAAGSLGQGISALMQLQDEPDTMSSIIEAAMGAHYCSQNEEDFETSEDGRFDHLPEHFNSDDFIDRLTRENRKKRQRDKN